LRARDVPGGGDVAGKVQCSIVRESAMAEVVSSDSSPVRVPSRNRRCWCCGNTPRCSPQNATRLRPVPDIRHTQFEPGSARITATSQPMNTMVFEELSMLSCNTQHSLPQSLRVDCSASDRLTVRVPIPGTREPMAIGRSLLGIFSPS